MFSNFDQEGHHYQLIKKISEHRKSKEALGIKDVFYQQGTDGPKVPRKTTIGWEFLVSWKDGSANWIKLKDLKQSNPVELIHSPAVKGYKNLIFIPSVEANLKWHCRAATTEAHSFSNR